MLTNMKVFNQQLQTMTIETLAQQVEKFNAASAGAIVLTNQGFEGDYRFENFFASLHAAQRRVDRYGTNTTASATNLAQLQEIGVKVAGGFGPIAWEPSQLSWVMANPAAALEAISRNLSEAIMKDQLNTAISAAVAAIEAQGTANVYDTGTGPITYADINKIDTGTITAPNTVTSLTNQDRACIWKLYPHVRICNALHVTTAQFRW